MLFRLRGPLAEDPTATVLHALLIGTFGYIVVFGAILLPFFVGAKRLSLLVLVFLVIQLTITRALLRRGFMRGASFVYLGGTWLMTTFVTVFGKGINSAGLVFYIALPILAAWLLGFRAALWTAALCLLCALVLAMLASAGVQPPVYFPGPPFGIWTVVLYSTVISTVPAAQVLRVLKEALAASQRDVAQRMQAEEELRRHHEKLEELVAQRTVELVEARDQALAANRAKSVFLANMSHELRTPLNAILGFARILHDESSSEGQRRDLSIVRRSGEHLLYLIDEVLEMAKAEVGRRELQLAPCDIGSVGQQVVEMICVRARDKGLKLSFDRSPDLPPCALADAPKLRQVLINLLGNAINYTERGSVGLRISAIPAGGWEQSRIVFEVEDTGIGIAPEDQERIFDPFVQVAKRSAAKGTGLGLTITRQFVSMMGGTITLASIPGEGSRFRVEVPVQLTGPAERTVPAEQDDEQIYRLEPGQPEYRVLAVDDEPDNSAILERFLKAAGFQVRLASNGVQAVAAFESWRPHFIWMDLRMPEMDGMEATRRIRAMTGGAEVKIAALTASASENDRDQVLAGAFDDFVKKPFRNSHLFGCMARHLGVRYRTVSPQARSSLPVVDMADALNALPPDLIAELRAAIIALDIGAIQAAISRIGERDATVSIMVSEMTDRFEFTQILKKLDRERGLSASQ